MTAFIKLLKNDSGAAAAEYALILAVVGAAIAFGAYALGGAVSNSMEEATNCINSPPTTDGGACG